jgi:hypothetical protein
MGRSIDLLRRVLYAPVETISNFFIIHELMLPATVNRPFGAPHNVAAVLPVRVREGKGHPHSAILHPLIPAAHCTAGDGVAGAFPYIMLFKCCLSKLNRFRLIGFFHRLFFVFRLEKAKKLNFLRELSRISYAID